MQGHNVKQLGRISVYAKCTGDACRARDSAGSNPRLLCLKKKDFFIEFITSLCFFSRSSRQKSIAKGPELPSSLVS